MKENPKKLAKILPKILIVEDDSDIRANIKIYIESVGFYCLEASDGAAAIEITKRKNPDLILLDIMMPVLNGFQVCKILKGDPKYKSIPIIMLSAKSDKADTGWAEKLGSDSYITKPFEFVALEKSIRKFIKK